MSLIVLSRVIHNLYLTEGFLNRYPVNMRAYYCILCCMLLLQPPISLALTKLVLIRREKVAVYLLNKLNRIHCQSVILTMT